MPTSVTFVVDDEDFVVRRGVAVIAGYTHDNRDGLRIITVEDTPVWDQIGLLESAIQKVRVNMSRMWG